jgi:two-component system chemotaxis response regulator CheB
MPQSALDSVQVDHVLKAAANGPFLMQTTQEFHSEPSPMPDNDERLGREVALAADPTKANALELPYGADATPAALGCPSCHGTLWEINEDKVTRYRCQAGHAYSSASLMAAQNRDLDDALWAACRTLEENATLARRPAARAGASNHAPARAHFEAKAKGASERAALIRRALSLSTRAGDSPGGDASEADELAVAGGTPEPVPQATPRPRGNEGAADAPGRRHPEAGREPD